MYVRVKHVKVSAMKSKYYIKNNVSSYTDWANPPIRYRFNKGTKSVVPVNDMYFNMVYFVVKTS